MANFLSSLKGNVSGLLSPIVDTKNLLEQYFNNPYDKNYLPKPGHKFVPGSNIQAPIGSELLRGIGSRGAVAGAQTPVPTQMPTQAPQTPAPTQAPVQTSSPQQGFRIAGVPNNTAQILGQVFDPMQEATNSARVLTGEGGGTGENRGFDPTARNFNSDGSEDRGLFQINSNTFGDFMRRKRKLLASVGINDYADMFDPYKNALMAEIIFNEQGWKAWFGAPPDLRGE